MIDIMNIESLTFKPVTLAEWPDLQTLFSEPGVQNGCWCMYWRVRRADFNRYFGESHRLAMQALIASGCIPGILAYLEGIPVGWCSVAPREAFSTLERSPTLKRVDNQPVWSITCFYIARAQRLRGMTSDLIEAAITYATNQGARIIEAYPLIPEETVEPRYERYTGVISTYLKLGFTIAAQRSACRPVMRFLVE